MRTRSTSRNKRLLEHTSLPLVTPSAEKFAMPAEWTQHKATWLVWPNNRSDWPGKLDPVDWCYVELVRHLVTAEPVAIVFRSLTQERRALGRLSRSGVDLNRVETHIFPTNRSWIRDNGPTFVTRVSKDKRETEVALVDWHFNGWAKYKDWSQDDLLPMKIEEIRGFPRFEARTRNGHPIVFEGGSIDVNGNGAALATEECLLDPIVQTRNPGLGRNGTEGALHDYLGVNTVIWLWRGIAGDDTHGHVDEIARFVDSHTVVAAVETDTSDENHHPLAENFRRLQRVRLQGHKLTVIPIPMPKPLQFQKRRLPASYLNFYIGNEVVLVPTFNDRADRTALDRLASLFPNREIVGIHAVDLILGLGSLHCITLPEPTSQI